MKKILILCLLLSSVALGQQAPRTSFPSQNFIINGDATFNQRGAITSIADGAYFVDRFQYGKTSSVVHNAGQGIDAPTLAQSGHQSTYCATLTLTTPDTSIAAGDLVVVSHKVEGTNFAQLVGKPFTLSFWTKHTLAGTYSVALRNSAKAVSYVTTYTVNASETWEKKVVTFPTPTTGTWLYDNGIGLEIVWTVAAGSTYQTATLNTWQAGNYTAATTQVNGTNTGATYFRLAQLMLNSGPTAAPFALAGGDVQGELAKAQRYYQKSGDEYSSAPCVSWSFASSPAANANRHYVAVFFPVRMRIQPVIYTCNDSNGATGGTTVDGSYSYVIDTVNNFTNGTISGRSANGFNLFCTTGSTTMPCRSGYRADAEL